MNIVVAPDSFKGSLTSVQASEIMKKAITSIDHDIHVTLKPMADGGEGTLDALLSSTSGTRVPITCTGPLGEQVNTAYAVIDANCAIIECASIAGLIQVPIDKRNPDITTTFGIGEAIVDALDRGCTSIILALGGSATNDGGLGMLQALGMRAWDLHGHKTGIFGKDVQDVNGVSFTNIDPRLAKVTINVACDVDNPLSGDRGASKVYGPQKGSTPYQINKYDAALHTYGELVEASLGKPLKNVPGAGAAGGLGFALLAIGGELVSGAELIAGAMHAEKAIRSADLILTGEGQSDEQTLYGKAPGYIAALGRKHHVPAVLISGSLDGNLDVLSERFAGCFSIVDKPTSLQECMEKADVLLYQQTKQVIHLLQHFLK
ncbi:glycerate kinase [Lentibacillus cibarius]|uniref:Glycerate kinase n=1 Tax=Lentibacillus cibarius TaxID=2583219 RepID=A0A549YER4_9BACI|nr:glycerate kinase [Lentibacillus cibarius]TMN21467.1 glycerate kinase [Lentibacillus cibarius]TRM10365.1 glycerate kinase [Lentibacillus cibarius]